MATQINLDTSTRVDITCRKGDTFSLEFTFTDSAGVAINLTGYTWKMAGVSGGLYVYDLQSTTGGSVKTWIYGLFTINEDISE